MTPPRDADFTGAATWATMPSVNGEDLADDTFLAAAPSVVARAVSDPRRWAAWWPDLDLTVRRRRGAQGIQWAVAGGACGTAEIWLESQGDGTVLHFYLRAALTDRQRGIRTVAWKRSVHALKDELEAGRVPGMPVRRARAAQGRPPSGR
jgi:hypothetical protein